MKYLPIFLYCISIINLIKVKPKIIMNHNLIFIFWYWIVTFIVWIIILPFFIKFVIRLRLWKQIREEATIWKAKLFSKLHQGKNWTPTMWWAAILGIVIFMVLASVIIQKLWYTNNSLVNQKETFLSLFTLVAIWFVWLVDDYMNVREIWRTKWLSARFKMFWLLLFAAAWAFWFYYKLWWNVTDEMWHFIRTLKMPFLWDLEIWIFFIPVFVFIIVAGANSVNITDWLDWLAGWLLLFAYSVYAYITYDQWLLLLTTLCIVTIWALLAFLWYNVKPAKIYMWDVWSLALWANLGIMAMLTNTMIIFIIVTSVFIFETLSVIMQLTSKKFRNWKKVFLIAPFHHHLEALWWKEENVVFRLWLIWILLSAIWIITYIIQAHGV